MTRLRNSRRGFTAVELVLVIVVLATVVTVTMWQVENRRQAMLREESAANLRSLYDTFQQSAVWSSAIIHMGPYLPHSLIRVREVWPVASGTPGHLAPDQQGFMLLESLLKVGNKTAFVSPAHPEAEQMRAAALTNPRASITDNSYWYLSYALPNEAAGLRFVEAYRQAVLDTGEPPAEYEIKVKPFEVRPEARESFRKPVPIMIERPGLQRGGSNVLFEHGRVVFMKYPGEWPMTEKFIKALESLDSLKVKE